MPTAVFAAIGAGGQHLIVGKKGLAGPTFENLAFELGGSADGVWAGPEPAPGAPTGLAHSVAGPNTRQGFVGYQAGFHDRNFTIGDTNINRCHTWNQTNPQASCWALLQGIPAALQFVAAQGLTFKGCRFSRLGVGGLWLTEGSRDNMISNCTFEDISGSALTLGRMNRRP